MINLKGFLAFSVGFALALGVALPGSSLAQFSSPSIHTSSVVAPTTSGIAAQAITDAISNSIRDVLNARPVVNREKVAVVKGLALGKMRSFAVKGQTRAVGDTTGAGAGGARMVTALSDGSLGLWDLDDGRELLRLR